MSYDAGNLITVGQVKSALRRVSSDFWDKIEVKEVQLTLPNGITEKRYILTRKLDTRILTLLHFDNDNNVLADECNIIDWEAINSPTVGTTDAKFGSAIQFDKTQQQMLMTKTPVELGGQAGRQHLLFEVKYKT